MQDCDLAVRKRRESGAGRWMEQDVDDVVGAGDHKVGGRCNGHGDVLRKPCYCVYEAFAMSFPHPDAVTAVAFHCRANVPTVKGVWRPTCPLVGLLVY